MADKQKVGFIGVGLMGHGMAKNILEKGYPLWVMGHSNRAPVEDLVKRGAEEAKSPAAMARACDVIFLCVTGSPQVEQLVRGADGIKAGAREGLIVVDSSTADPTSTLALAAELAPLGVRLVDAPLGRTPKEAEAGRLNALVGADPATFEALLPLLRCWAENVIHVGPVGAGHKVKLINNFIAMSTAAVLAEAFTTAKLTGVDFKALHEVVSAGPLNSTFYQNVTKWVIGGDPKAHLFTLRNCLKDITYYNRLAEAAPATAVVAGSVKQIYTIALAMGKGDDHMPMISDAVAELNGIKLHD